MIGPDEINKDTNEVERLRSELQSSNDCHISEVNRFTKERDDLKELIVELKADIINYKQVEKHYLSLITMPLNEQEEQIESLTKELTASEKARKDAEEMLMKCPECGGIIPPNTIHECGKEPKLITNIRPL